MPTSAELTAARSQRSAAVAAAAASAINETANTIAAVIGSNNDLAIARMTIRAREAMQGLLDDAAAASTAQTSLGTQRETQQQIQALTDLINQLQAAQAAHPPPTDTAVQPIVTTPTTPAVTPLPGAKSHTALYVGLGIAGTAIVGGIAYFALRAKPTSHPHRNPWNSSSDALGGAD